MILGANGAITSGYKPEIDYQDLYAYYDPGNTASYDQSTNEFEIFDISGNSGISLVNSYGLTPGLITNDQGYSVLFADNIGDHWLTLSSFTFGPTDPYTIIHIARYSGGDTSTISFRGINPDMRFGLNLGNAGRIQSGTTNEAGEPASNDWKFLVVNCDGGGIGKLSINKDTPTNLSGLDQMPVDLQINRNSSSISQIQIGPLLIYKRQLTQAEIFYIYDYYNSKFNFA
jgi:hypothetical protein